MNSYATHAFYYLDPIAIILLHYIISGPMNGLIQ